MTSSKTASSGRLKAQQRHELDNNAEPASMPAERAPRIEDIPSGYSGPLYQSRHNYPSA